MQRHRRRHTPPARPATIVCPAASESSRSTVGPRRHASVLEMRMRLIRIIGRSVGLGWVAVLIWRAQAEFKLRYPIVEFRELEIEHNGSVTFDKRNSGKNNSQSYPTEIEFGFLPWWKIGLETNIEAQPGQNIHYEATALENYFQLTPQ